MVGIEFLAGDGPGDRGCEEELRTGAGRQAPAWLHRAGNAALGAVLALAALAASSAPVPAPPARHRAPFYQPYYLPWRGNAQI